MREDQSHGRSPDKSHPRKREKSSAQSLFETAREQRDSLSYEEFCSAVLVNVHYHGFPTRGLANAIQLAEWMAVHKFPLPKKTWDSVLLKMIEMEYPLDQLTEWMDTQPNAQLTTSMIYVLSSALERLRRPQVVLPLVQHYLTCNGLKPEDPSALLGYLVPKILAAKPGIQRLEEYMSLTRSSHSSLHWSECRCIVAYYLNPSNHERGKPCDAILTSFLDFLQENSDVLTWHSSLDLSKYERVGDDACVASERAPLVRVFEQGLSQVEQQDRYPLLLEVYGSVRDPESLYDLANKYVTNDLSSLEYDLFCSAIVANVHRHQDPSVGLTNAIRLSRWMAAKGFQLPKKTWDSVLLRMIEMNYSSDQLTEWMDTQPNVELTKSMIYVLSNAMDKVQKPHVMLSLVHHYLNNTDRQEKADDRHALLGYLVETFLASQPSVLQLEEYVACMNSNRTVISRKNCANIVSYYTEHPSHHEAGRSQKKISAGLAALLRKHKIVFKRLLRANNPGKNNDTRAQSHRR